MIDTEMRRRGECYRALTELTAVEESRDGSVTVTVGVLGDLRDLRFDPRVARCRDAGALAESIMRTVRAAADAAHRSSAGLVTQLMPGHPRGVDVDLLFGPVLYRLDRRVAVTRETGAPGPDIDGLRQRVLAMRDQAEDVLATVRSADGLVAATVSGRGALVNLTLDRRTCPVRHANQLAENIRATARRATAHVGEQLAVTRRTS